MTHRYDLFLLAAFLVALAVPQARAQDGWSFRAEQTVRFEEADSSVVVGPYLAAVDASGTLWVVSSAEHALYPNTYVNALYRAAPGDTLFKKVDDYTDTTVRTVTGLTTVGGDVYVSVRLSNPGDPEAPADPYYPYSQILRYPAGDVSGREVYSAQNGYHDYGSWITGLAATSDGHLFAGRSYQVTIVAYDFTDGADAFGNTTGAAGDDAAPMEPGGALYAQDYSDLIHDAAVVPGGDYSEAGTPVYTSRNQPLTHPDYGSGGVAVWTGGTASSPTGYTAQRVTDPASLLALDGVLPYGLAADADGRLYVAGTDSTRRWVKAFDVQGNFAFEAADLQLPSSTTTIADERDEAGAPFAAPADVALSPDGTRAYVVDRAAAAAFVFAAGGSTGAGRAPALPQRAVLGDAFPNPARGTASVSFTLPHPQPVRLVLYDVLGREVAVLVDELRPRGRQQVAFDVDRLGAGVYLYRLEAAGATHAASKRLVVY